MPLVKIALSQDFHQQKVKSISDAVHAAMVEAIGIPEGDRFHVISRHDGDTLIFDSSFLADPPRTSLVLIHIFLRLGRSLHTKQLLYRSLAEKISVAAEISSSNILITLTENDLEDWSFSGGSAQYIEHPELFAQRRF